MKKRVFGRQLSRERDSRRALFRSLIRALVFNGKIVTTRAKAKAIQGEAESLVTLAKNGSVAAKRRALSRVGNDRSIAEYIYKSVVPALSERKSGFTKLTSLPQRVGDRAKIVRLEWVVAIERKSDKQSLVTTGSKKQATNKKKEKQEVNKNLKENILSKVKSRITKKDKNK